MNTFRIVADCFMSVTTLNLEQTSRLISTWLDYVKPLGFDSRTINLAPELLYEGKTESNMLDAVAHAALIDILPGALQAHPIHGDDKEMQVFQAYIRSPVSSFLYMRDLVGLSDNALAEKLDMKPEKLESLYRLPRQGDILELAKLGKWFASVYANGWHWKAEELPVFPHSLH